MGEPGGGGETAVGDIEADLMRRGRGSTVLGRSDEQPG
jgi:hypothetical protein